MWWGKGNDKPVEPPKPSPPETAAKQFDPKLPDEKKLPDKLQKIIDESDKNENFFDELVDG
jgi:fission process protein 1